MQIPRASSPLFEFDLNAKNSVTLDLSAQNTALEKINSSKTLATYIDQVLKAKGKTYALGGYAEKRVIYQRFKHFNNNPTTERNVHLGLDVWAPAHTTILSPADALVHSFAFNNNSGDYGALFLSILSLGKNTLASTVTSALSQSKALLWGKASKLVSTLPN
jgi:hypothetical protein